MRIAITLDAVTPPGPDEFLCLLPDVAPGASIQAVERLREDLLDHAGRHDALAT